VGVSIGSGDYFGLWIVVSHRLADLSQKQNGVCLTVYSEQPYFHVINSAGGSAQAGQSHSARQVRYIANGSAYRQRAGGFLSYEADHVGEIGSQRPFTRVLDVNDIRPALDGSGDFLLAHDTDQQLHSTFSLSISWQIDHPW